MAGRASVDIIAPNGIRRLRSKKIDLQQVMHVIHRIEVRYALISAVFAMVQTATAQVPSTGGSGRTVADETRGELIHAGEHDEPWVDTEAVDEPEVMYASNGLLSAGGSVYPLVREFLWDACFKHDALFAGYAHSLHGGEEASILVFRLLVNRNVWKQTATAARQASIQAASDRFQSRLAELNLEGELEIVIVNG